jgi:uncharacterized protein YndB with AHSA1/START domain
VVELEIPIDAPREKVWHALMNEPHQWWHKDFYVAKRPAKFVIEPKLGGRGYEDCGDGTGFVWFEIIGLEPNEMLYVQGQIRPPFGGPATSLIIFTLEDDGDNKTVLKVSDAVHGHVSEKMAESLDSGWKMLFGELKSYSEKA